MVKRCPAGMVLFMGHGPAHEAARFGEAGRRRVGEHFAIARMVRQREDAYTAFVGKLVAGRAGSV